MSSANYDTILTSLDDGIMTITMNRPERLNAWTYQMGAELQQAIEAGNADASVDVFILTGAGRGFCAGADIKDLFKDQADAADAADAGTNEQRPARDWVGLVRRAKPVIAAVNGVAVGVGLTQILPCDFIMASSAAKFSARFVKMGVVPELASSYYLVARTGYGLANRMMLTGETIDAIEAARIGLIDELVDDADNLLERATQLAKQIGENPPGALGAVKALVTANMAEPDLKEVQRREMAALAEAYKSPEHHEAIAAFIEKRPPNFKNLA
jgi:2-(1,2-epoxy-1,2-dihydrophenyl)acetyl-CoA isomerase